jgi:hypothetical protein
LDLLNTYRSPLQVTIALSLIQTLCSSLQHVLSLLSLLCLHQSLPGDGSQECPLLPCSRSYRLATFPRPTHCSNCCGYNISALTENTVPLLLYLRIVAFCWDVHVIATQPLPSNGRCLQSHYLVKAVV